MEVTITAFLLAIRDMDIDSRHLTNVVRKGYSLKKNCKFVSFHKEFIKYYS